MDGRPERGSAATGPAGVLSGGIGLIRDAFRPFTPRMATVQPLRACRGLVDPHRFILMRTLKETSPKHRSAVQTLESLMGSLDAVRRSQLWPWHAIPIYFLRGLKDRVRFVIGLLFGLGFGIIYAVLEQQVARPMIHALLYAVFITYTSTIPWRLLLARRRPVSLAWFLVANGTVATIVGCTTFFFSTCFSIMVTSGWKAVVDNVYGLMLVSVNGILYVLVGIAICFGEEVDRYTRRTEAREKRLRRLAEESRLVALRAQINPHFFFNALNTIAALIPTRPEDAEQAVEMLATSLRPVLTRDQPMLSTLRAELDVARSYGAIESLRLGERVELNINVEEELMDIQLPSLSLQPLLENAVVHGAARQIVPYRIGIDAAQEDGYLVVTLKNAPIDRYDHSEPAHLVQVIPGKGHAIDNIDARLRLLFGADAGLKVNHGDLVGIATLRVPLGEGRNDEQA